MRLYFANVKWYDSYKNDETHDKLFVFSESMSEALNQLENAFPGLFKVNIEELNSDCDSNMFYLPHDLDKKMIETLRNANIY